MSIRILSNSGDRPVAGIDLGTTMGYAFSTEPITSGITCFKQDRFAGGGARFLIFKRWLKEAIEFHQFRAIFYEAVRAHNGTDAAHVYGGMMAMLTSLCEEYEIPYYGVGVGQNKKFASGKGNIGKAGMIHAAALKWPDIKIIDDNHADALWLMEYGLSKI